MSKILSENEFIDYYKETGKLPSPLCNWNRSKPFNTSQLKAKYKEYIKKLDKEYSKAMIVKPIKKSGIIKVKSNKNKSAKEKKANLVAEACAKCHKIGDKTPFMNFFNNCSKEEQYKLKSKMLGDLGEKWDAAHIISRSSSSKLATDLNNLVLLPHYIHLCLDNYINPITDKKLTQEEHNNIWIRIIGIDRWNSLHGGSNE